MGEVRVQIQLENTGDRVSAKRGYLPAGQVRCQAVEMVVDTGAVMVVLPQDMVEALGIDIVRKAIVTYADERKDERPIAGPLTVRFGNREATTDCIVGPPASEPLLGQIPLEAMDLLVDQARRQLIVRPESPYLPMHKVK